MSGKVINTRIKQKRDTESNWQSKNPKLLNGEIILVDMSDGELRAKVGDGTRTYSALPFSDTALRNLIDGVDDKIDAVDEQIENVKKLVGDTAVAAQISNAVDDCITNMSVSGKIITYTRADGTTGTITTQDTNTTYSAAGSSLGLVKSGGDVTISSGVITVKDDSHNHTIANVDNLQTTLDGKAPKSHGIHYIEGTGDTAGTWLGTHDDITEYYVGLVLAYKIGVAGLSGGTTLNINNLGAVTVVKNATSAISTNFAVNSVIFLVYTIDSDGTAYWKAHDYDSNTKTTTGTSNKVSTKLFLAGATSQASSATTYSNKNVYIGTDNCLYSGDKKVATTEEVAAVSELVGDKKVSEQIEDVTDGCLTGLSVSGKVITYTKGDGSTGTITTQDTNTVYTHPSYTTKSNGLYKVTVDGTGHVSGTTVVAKSDITALGIPAQDTTYSAATTSAAGLMSASDKSKLDGIATGANKITVDSALSSTSTNPVQNKVVNTAISNLNTLVGDTKVSTQISNAIANKSDTGHTHNYASSSSAGGSATSAVKLDTSTAGSATQPVYFSGGKPVETTYTLGASVPSGAKFTDTTYGVVSTTANGLAPKRDGSTTKFLRGDGTWAVPPDTNTTYSLSSFGITATADELNKLDGCTATVTELNYVDGVTSNIQTQLNGKAASSHNHAASNITSGTLSSDRLPTVPVSKGGTGATTAAAALTNLGITATATELNYVDGVTSNVQTQLDKKLELNKKTHINSSANLNSYTTPGTYAIVFVADSKTISNTPYAEACGTLVVSSMRSSKDSQASGVYQTFYGYNGIVYYRTTTDNSNWSKWRHYLTNILASGDYGNTLPAAGTVGRIFFKKVSS